MTGSVRERTRPTATSGSRRGSRRVRGGLESGPQAGTTRRPTLAGRVIGWATVLILVAGAVVIWATPVLGLRAVDVVTADGTPAPTAIADEVHIAVAVPAGTPLARLDLAAIARRVRAVDTVAAATVARDWPSGLTVTVRPRVAVAITQANGRWWALDATGLPFEQLPERPADLLPLQLASPGAGDRATMAALAVLASLSPEVRGEVAGLSAATAYDVTLFLTGGRSVIWGSATEAAAKNAVIPALLRQPGTVIDVSDPTLVTVRDHR